MKKELIIPVIALSSILLSGCLFGSKSSRLVPTESITTTEETTTEITSAETTTETTVETSETTAETTVSEETTENTTTSEESSATKGTTKATNKTPTTTKSPSKKPSTTKPKTTTTKAPTKKPVATKAPTKVPTKAPTKKPTPSPTPVPEKQYAIVKWKFLITSNDHDEDGNNIKRTFYGEFKSYTRDYGTKSASKYNICDSSEKKAFIKKCDPNYRNYSSYPVKIIERLN